MTRLMTWQPPRRRPARTAPCPAATPHDSESTQLFLSAPSAPLRSIPRTRREGRPPRFVIRASLTSLLLAVRAGALTPYTADPATLHLWHLDQAAAPAADSATANPLPLASLGGGATLANPGAAGFGTALSTHDAGPDVAAGTGTDAWLAPLPLSNSTGDNSAWSFADPATGAFTFEALVRPDFDPMVSQPLRNATMQILGGEQDGGTNPGTRSWQFRLVPVGVNPNRDGITAPLVVPALEFINVRNGDATIEHKIVLLPTTGPHAITAGAWFHVAVACTGEAGTPDNLRFFWTRLDPLHTAANLLGTKTLANDLLAGQIDFAVGQIGRSPSQLNFIGLLDEVRISSVARAADAFLFRFVDSEPDGLHDPWEMRWFQHLGETATGDPDRDGLDNLAEYQLGSDPTTRTDPDDLDNDGLPDNWERSWFGHLGQTAGDDPDGDGETNATERSNNTAPVNRGSNSSDTDADSLPDAWEHAHFATLAHNGGDDPDGDRFSNLQEQLADTDPADPGSRPAGTAAKLVPVDDNDPATSEFGFGGSSGINVVSFIRHNLTTVGNQQFIAFYGRHQFDPAHPSNNKIWVGRRTLGTAGWEVFRHPSFTANNINDGHDVVCFAIDGDGYLHLSWGMHADAFHYARSTGPVTGAAPIAFGPDGTMTGHENTVTYPQFYNLPGGDLLYHFREGGSGAGDQYLNRWDDATNTWSMVHLAAGAQAPFIKGRGWSPDYNAYPNLPQLDPLGRLVFTWCWRYNSNSPAGETGYQTNNNMAYARSDDAGVTWRRHDGTPYALPISRNGENGDPATAVEHIMLIPEGSSLINSGGQDFDSNHHPVIATWWAPEAATGNHRRQYQVIFRHDNGTWQRRQVSNRTNDNPATKFSEAAVRDLGRPIALCDRDDRIIVLYRDNHDTNGITVVHSLPKALDPDRLLWTTFELTTDNMGIYEPVFDWELWRRDGVLHLFHHPAEGGFGFTAPANTATRVAVLEWDVTRYFRESPHPRLTLPHGQPDAFITCPSEPSFRYRLWSGTTLDDWQPVDILTGTGGEILFTHPGGNTGPRRFWRIERLEP